MFEEGDVVINKKTSGLYKIIATEANMVNDDPEDYVIYKHIHSGKVWIREKEEFEQKFENYDF